MDEKEFAKDVSNRVPSLTGFHVDYYDYECGQPCTPNGCRGHSTDIPISFTVNGITFYVDGVHSGDFPNKEDIKDVQQVVRSIGALVQNNSKLKSEIIRFSAEAVDKLSAHLVGSVKVDGTRDPIIYEQGIGCEKAAKMLREIASLLEVQPDGSDQTLMHFGQGRPDAAQL